MSTPATAQICLAPAASGEEAGELRLDNAQDYLDGIIEELRTQGVENKGSLVSVLEYLSLHISRTREQIGTLRTGGARLNPLSATADQLEEVVGETARATHDIISATEEIERLAAKTGPDTAQPLNAAVIRIYEACAFQDIGGQRIAKAIGALQFIDARIAELIQACGPLPAAPEQAPGDDDGLLNGPQLGCDASRQKEIDELFGEA